MSSPTSVSNVVANPQLIEYGKFVRLDGDTRFPAISVINPDYLDASNAFKDNVGVPPLTSIDVYPKYAVLTYETNTLGSGGFAYLSAGGYLVGNFSAILPLTTTTLAGITAQYTQNDILKGISLPAGVRIDAPITAVSGSNPCSAILYYAD